MSDDETPIRVSKPAFPKYLIVVAALALFSLGVLAFGVVAAVRYSQRETPGTSPSGSYSTVPKVSPATLPPISDPTKSSPAPTGATAEREGMTWSVEDLAKYLKGTGAILTWELDAKDTAVVHAKSKLDRAFTITHHPGPIQAEDAALKRPWIGAYACVWGNFSFNGLNSASVIASLGGLKDLRVNDRYELDNSKHAGIDDVLGDVQKRFVSFQQFKAARSLK